MTSYYDLKKILLYSMLLFAVMCCVYFAFAFYIQLKTNQIRINEMLKNESKIISLEQSILSNEVNGLISDLLYITDELESHLMIEKDLKHLKEEWIAYSDRKEIYDQIQFIDVQGNEQIRINYSESGSFSSHQNQLKNILDSEYFFRTLDLNNDQVFLSKMDVHIENGVLARPIGSIVRLSTPVFNADHQLLGITILNYKANHLLETFQEIASASAGELFLINPNGYYFYNSADYNKEWSFMSEEEDSISFITEYGQISREMQESYQGQVKTDIGYFTYKHIFYGVNENIILGEGSWTLLSYLPRSNLEISNQSCSNLFLSICYNQKVMFLFIFICAIVFGTLTVKNKRSQEQIRHYSEHDELTGAYNRRAGFILLENAYKDMKHHGKLSVSFIDINGLKEVNDVLGHEIGDQLIKDVIKGIKKHINDETFIIRLGGDEFLLVFKKKSLKEAEKNWKVIAKEFEKINHTKDRKYIVSVSHGMETFRFYPFESIESVINAADKKMYLEKRELKKDVTVIRKDK